jgi:hypothetical protein
MEIMENNMTRGGEFLLKETPAKNVFTPEDFSEEQLMMKEAVVDFSNREIWPQKPRLEKKDYDFNT